MGDGFGVLEKNFQQKEIKTLLKMNPNSRSLRELWLEYKFGIDPRSLRELWFEYKFGIDGRKPADQVSVGSKYSKTWPL
jgi:hypothetical protein